MLIVVNICILQNIYAQGLLEDTKIKGFVHFDFVEDLDDWKPSFSLGEQDLFITSEVTDKLNFLGESVFKYDNGTGEYGVSIERIIFNYNYRGNHNVLAGKHHTPINFWNDSYHHGRVFFPTIDRPVLFSNNIIPIHTTGLSLQGQNLTDLKFGYDVMFGNGISTEDNPTNSNNWLSTTVAVHIKPVDGMRTGLSFYYDQIDSTSGGTGHHSTGNSYEEIDHQIYTAYFSYISSKIEVITEASFVVNKGEVSGVNNTLAYYGYVGVPIKGTNFVPYVRYDLLRFDDEEVYYTSQDQNQLVIGMRHEFNYKSVLKLEYQFTETELSVNNNVVKVQIALGF